ncbi:MAG TPA: transporter substrate-binding domain-containing protein [Propionibacteriaceae bacterium]|nr:transporter substrate-binding domain-containing protein [Propionibacteriaceae bacterium]
MSARRLIISLIVTICTAATTLGCSGTVPRDPERTLERVTGATLRVGVSHHPPWTVTGPAPEPTGSEIELVKGFAQTLDAEVEWVVGGEEMLIAALEHGELHLVIGGLTAETPWVEQVAVTKPYAEMRDPRGERQELVMAAPPGENAYLLELEKFLLSQDRR